MVRAGADFLVEDRDVQIGQLRSVCRWHISPAVLAPHEEASIAEDPHPELDWCLQEAAHEFVSPAEQVNRQLNDVNRPDSQVSDRLKPEEDSDQQGVQEPVREDPDPNNSRSQQVEPELGVDLCDSADQLEERDDEGWQEVGLIASALAVKFPVAVNVHVRPVDPVAGIFEPCVIGVLLDVAGKGILPEVLEFFFRSLFHWSLEFIAGLIDGLLGAVGVFHAGERPVVVAEIIGHEGLVDPLDLL